MNSVTQKIRHRQGLLILVVLMIVLSPEIIAQQYRFMEYGLSNGLPQPYVYTIDQDASGYLWIGTGDGLARFDGKTFQIFTNADYVTIILTHPTPMSLECGLDI